MTASLEALRVGEHQRVTKIMGEVFDDDPIQRWVFGDTFDVGLFFGTAARALYLKHGHCWASTDSKAAVLMLPPKVNKQVPIYKMLSMLPSMLKHGGLSSITRGIIADERVAKKAPKRDYFYIFAIGAAKSARGQGYGSMLLKQCITSAEAQGLPIYLENSKLENIAFYQRHGFEVIEKISIGNASPPMWLMLREPRT